MSSSFRPCPQCDCLSVRRSRRRFFDWPLIVMGLKAARCTSCGLRFYRPRSVFHNAVAH